jgi:hypothetical protein
LAFENFCDLYFDIGDFTVYDLFAFTTSSYMTDSQNIVEFAAELQRFCLGERFTIQDLLQVTLPFVNTNNSWT